MAKIIINSEDLLGPDGTIKAGKELLKAHWEDGIVCPCCRQLVKLYERKLNSAMAYALILIYRHHRDEGSFGAYFHVENYLKMLEIPSSIRGDFPKLRYWGLLERKPAEMEGRTTKSGRQVSGGGQAAPPTRGDEAVIPGYYRITPKGIQFVKNLCSVPRISLLYNDGFYGHKGPEVNIYAALEDKFDYMELMYGKQ